MISLVAYQQLLLLTRHLVHLRAHLKICYQNIYITVSVENPAEHECIIQLEVKELPPLKQTLELLLYCKLIDKFLLNVYTFWN